LVDRIDPVNIVDNVLRPGANFLEFNVLIDVERPVEIVRNILEFAELIKLPYVEGILLLKY
jgi:hypothetical protein